MFIFNLWIKKNQSMLESLLDNVHFLALGVCSGTGTDSHNIQGITRKDCITTH